VGIQDPDYGRNLWDRVIIAEMAPILWESGIGSDVMKPIAAPIVGGMITSTIQVLILVPVFFAIMKEGVLEKEFER
jgi:copper/silver efflux system protein